MFRRFSASVIGLAAVVLLAGCGTATFDNTFLVLIDDPSDRLGSETVAVSIFDNTMGFSAEWAAKTEGTTSPGTPYAGSVFATETKMIFDSSPPRTVKAGLSVPAYNEDGYFSISFDPSLAQTQDLILPFVPWSESFPAGKDVVPLPVSVVSVADDAGWQVHLTVHIPPSQSGESD